MAQCQECLPPTNVAWVLAQCLMWVEFVVGSHLAPRVFLQALRFSSLMKNQHFKIQIPIFHQDRGTARISAMELHYKPNSTKLPVNIVLHHFRPNIPQLLTVNIFFAI